MHRDHTLTFSLGALTLLGCVSAPVALAQPSRQHSMSQPASSAAVEPHTLTLGMSGYAPPAPDLRHIFERKHHMNPGFITKDIHALLDYPVAFALIGAPFLLDLGESTPGAKWLSVGTGVAALILTVFTNHKLGLIRVLPYWFHVLVDGMVGVVFVAAPFVLGFKGLDAWYYWANAAAVLTVVSLRSPGSLSRTHTRAAATA